MNEKPICPKCHSPEMVKNGKVSGKQRYKCKNCNFQVTCLTPGGYPPETKAKALELYDHGLFIRAASRLSGVSSASVLNRIKQAAKKIYKKTVPGKAILIEPDEMWRFLSSKKNKLWLWKAYGRETGELIDWECGARDRATLPNPLERLSPWDTELYRTDNWAPRSEVIDEKKLFKSKSQTFYLEQNKGRQRHWYARFRRKSIVVSKTLEMVDLTMTLFAACHVNKCINNLASLFN